MSSALALTFRGKLCETLFPGRVPALFEKGEVLYDSASAADSFFFIRKGVVSIGAVSADGHEIIYDLRKNGDVAGELCVCGELRRDRAVALETTEAFVIPYHEVLEALQQNRGALQEVLRVFAGALFSAYDQTELLFVRDVVQRVIRTLQRLARELGRASEGLVEIETYLTQEELAQMAGASRERVSTALNVLRSHGLIHYSRRGRLMLDSKGLDLYCAAEFAAPVNGASVAPVS